MRFLSSGLVLSTALLASVAGHAQNYRPFGPGRHYHYRQALSADSSRFYLLTVDSVYAQGGDSIFCFNRNSSWRGSIASPRLSIFGAAFRWSASTGQATFTGFQGTDTVRILTRAAVGQSWAFSRQMRATLTGRQAGHVNGQADTLLSIALSDGQSLLLGRRYGFVQGPNLNYYLGSQIYDSSLGFGVLRNNTATFTLAGIPEMQLGVVDFDLHNVFDFQPGDQLYFRSESRNGTSCTASWTNKTVLAVRAQGDSVLYNVKGVSGRCGSLSQPTASQRWGTYQRTGYLLTGMWLQGTAVAEENLPALAVMGMMGGRPVQAELHIAARGAGWNAKYAPGLGRVAYYSSSGTPQGQPASTIEEHLVGYIKGTEVWGDTTSPRPLAVADDVRRLPATLAPNPSGDGAETRLTFSTDQPQAATLVLYDALGREAWRREAQLPAGEQRLAVGVNTLAPGLYRLRLTLADGRQRVLPLVRQ